MAENIEITGQTSDLMSQLAQVNTALNTIATTTTRTPPVPAAVVSSWQKLKDKIMENFKSITSFQGMVQTVMGTQMLTSIGGVIKQTEALNNQLRALKTHSMWAGLGADFERLGDITQGVATKMQLLPSISRATAFGIDLSNGKLEEFTILAQKLGIMMGKDLQSSFDDLITGVGRQSVLIMDNLGILLKRGEANAKFAKSNGIAVESMTAFQKMQAFLNESLLKGKEIVENINLEDMALKGTKAVNILESAIATSKRWISETFVDIGDSIGKFMFYATASMDEIGSLRRAEAREAAELLDREIFQTAMVGLSQTESYKKFYAEKKALGEKDLFIQQRYYSLYFKDMANMNSYAFNSATARYENESKLRQRKMFDESVAFVEHTEQYKKFYEEQRSMGKSDLDIKKEYVKQHMKNIELLTKDAFNDTMGNQTVIIDLFLTGIEKVEARWKQYQDMLQKQKDDEMSGKDKAKEAKKQAKMDKDAMEKWIEVRKIKAEVKAKEIDDEIKQEEAMNKASVRALRERQSLYNKTTEDNDKLKMAQNALYNAEAEQMLADSNANIEDLQKQRNEITVKNVMEQFKISAKIANDNVKLMKEIADFELWVKKDQFESEIQLIKDHNEHKKKLLDEDLKARKIRLQNAGIEEYEFEKDMGELKKEGINQVARFTAMIIDEVMFGEKEFHKEMIGDFAKMIGSQLISKGTFNVLEGAIATVMGLPWGPTQAAVGGAEIAAGVGMGGIGKAIGTTSDNKSDDKKVEASKDRNSNNNNNKSFAKVNTYLFPSKRAYNQHLQQSNNEIYG